MTDIKVHRSMKVEVIQDKKIVKTEELDKDSFKELMQELCESDLMLEGLRTATKLFKPSGYRFLNVKE